MIYGKIGKGYREAKTKYITGIIFLLIDDFAVIPFSALLGYLIDYLKQDTFDINGLLFYTFLLLMCRVISYLGFVGFAYCVFGSAGKLKMYFKRRIFYNMLRKPVRCAA